MCLGTSLFSSLAVRTRLELVTPCVTGMYSNQLNYRNISSFALLCVPIIQRAENETRTRDPNLGKVVLYQLSYFRIFVGSDGFEPPKAKASRFTVCPIWPLW